MTRTKLQDPDTGSLQPESAQHESSPHSRPVCRVTLHSNPSNVISFLNSQLSVSGDAFDLRKVPLLVAKRTNRPSLEPALDAIEVKDVTTVSKGNRKAIVVGGRRVGLVLDRGFVEGVAANGALC